MMSLLDLISQNQPHFQTHQALLVIGLQNDFIQPDGRLPVDTRNGFLDRIQTLIPKFRQLSANVIWVKTLYEADRMASDPATGEGDSVVVGGLVDGVESSTDDDDDLPKDLIPPTQSRSSRHKQRALDLLKRVSARKQTTTPRKEIQALIEEDEELFLLSSSKNGAACLPSTPGAEFIDAVTSRIEKADTVLQTTNYSAFLGTSLLLILRAKLVTELYICGCLTNVSVLATVIDAARHGIRINVIEDCLGFRKRIRHDEALRRMVDFLDANMVTSQEILSRDPNDKPQQPKKKSHESPKVIEEDLDVLVGNLQLNDSPENQRNSSRPTPSLSQSLASNGRQRTVSDVSVAESRATTDTKVSDEQFAEKLTQGARLPKELLAPAQPAAQNLVKSKIRMRSRGDRSKKKVEKVAKEGQSTPAKGDASPRTEPATASSVPPVRSPKLAEPPSSDSAPRSAAITKAESSDKLRQSPISKRDQALKSSASHPVLSSPASESKEPKSPTSRNVVRLALQRASKSDSSKAPPAQTPPPKSPTKPTIEASGTPPVNKAQMGKKLQSLANFPILRPGDRIAEGDSKVIYDFFPPQLRHSSETAKPLSDVIFQQLYNEVHWQRMLHQTGEVPRLVCCQGEFGADGSMPVYRHPTDQALPLLHFSPKVQVVRKQAEKLVGHPLNHVLIQLYRSGNDYISEHSDKTLDIVRGSSIVNVSFGAQRTMRLRTKKAAKASDQEETSSRETQRVAMPHNSMFVLGLGSNKSWLHGIMADKRLDSERSKEETAYSGVRVSLTFRHIGTFIDSESSSIWGQGATGKGQSEAQDVINEDEEENQKIVRAFSKENHDSDFDWENHYGNGFDVLHFRNAPDDLPIFFASNNTAETKMIQIFLAEKKINYTLFETPTCEKSFELDRQVCYRDNDINHTEVAVAVPVLLYLDRYYPLDRDDRGRACTSASYEIMVLVSALLKYWVNREVPTFLHDFVNMVEQLEERLAAGVGPFIAGRRFSAGDCTTWPALDEIITTWDEWSEDRFPALSEYYKMLWRKKKSVAKLREELPEMKKSENEGNEQR